MRIALRPVVVTIVVASMMVLAFDAPAFAAEGGGGTDMQADAIHPDAQLPSAPVEIDGTVLFQVRGAAAFPAEKRATAIARETAGERWLAALIEARVMYMHARSPPERRRSC